MFNFAQSGVEISPPMQVELPTTGEGVAGVSGIRCVVGAGKPKSTKTSSAVAVIPQGGSDHRHMERPSDTVAMEVKSCKVLGGELCTVLGTELHELLAVMFIFNL